MLIVGSLTHPGRERETNEDSLSVLLGEDAPTGCDALLAVADGMGGHAAGEVASQLAVQRLASELSTSFEAGVDVSSDDALRAAVEQAVARANEFVHRAAATQGRRGMGTTLTAALIAGSRAVIAHVGDSRAYLLRNGTLWQLTNDHSWVAEQMAAGILTPEQAAHHPQRNVITRALGASCQVRVDMWEVRLQAGDRLLLTSDGVHGVIDEDAIRQIVAGGDPQDACDGLIARANELGGPDNSTAIVAAVGEEHDRPVGASS